MLFSLYFLTGSAYSLQHLHEPGSHFQARWVIA